MKKIIFLRRVFGGHCSYSGYDILFDHVSKKIGKQLDIADAIETPRARRRSWVTKKLLQIARQKYGYGTSFYNTTESGLLEFKGFLAAYASRSPLIHYGYLESHYGLLLAKSLRNRIKTTKIIATVHHPSSWWKLYANPAMVRFLDGIVVVSKSEVDFFEQYLPRKVHYIPHGIDLEFFQPDPSKRMDEKFRCIFVGQWLRDIETMVNVALKVSKINQNIHFEIVYPQWRRQNKDFLYKVAYNENITFHHNLFDKQLRNLYQASDVLLLPLFDCTCNNAVLEAMASGLPIISSDVPGIHSYVNKSFSTLLPVADVDGMVDTVLEYYTDREKLSEQSKNSREFAAKNFNWDLISDQLINLYRTLM